MDKADLKEFFDNVLEDFHDDVEDPDFTYRTVYYWVIILDLLHEIYQYIPNNDEAKEDLIIDILSYVAKEFHKFQIEDEG